MHYDVAQEHYNERKLLDPRQDDSVLVRVSVSGGAFAGNRHRPAIFRNYPLVGVGRHPIARADDCEGSIIDQFQCNRVDAGSTTRRQGTYNRAGVSVKSATEPQPPGEALAVGAVPCRLQAMGSSRFDLYGSVDIARASLSKSRSASIDLPSADKWIVSRHQQQRGDGHPDDR